MNTQELIQNINECLSWIKEHKGQEEYEQKFLQLVEQRRRLRKIAIAEQERPAVAAYGESQKGKSYLIGNLLKTKDKTFLVKDENSEMVDFVDCINPIGNGKEATGVVTRFKYFETDNKYPVIVKLFSVADIATVLCDSYNEDIKYHSNSPYSESDMEKICNKILEYGKYDSNQGVLKEDDILDMQGYVTKYLDGMKSFCKSNYFQNVAKVARKIPTSDYADVFKYLWHENVHLTTLFKRLVNALEKLDFSREVYTNMDAVKHNGKNENTVMSVKCLYGLDEKKWNLTSDVFVKTGTEYKTVSSFPKCELSALCSEIVFKIEKEYLSDTNTYFAETVPDGKVKTGDMPKETLKVLPDKVTKDLFNEIDLLDFPGARNRETFIEDELGDTKKEDASNLVRMLLRGKVAYLFNNYNESRIINTLLFCHDGDNNSVTSMYITLKDWVDKYVGDTPEKRATTYERCGNQSPLFIIATKFNVEMAEDRSAVLNSDNAINGKWDGRFEDVLRHQIFNAKDYPDRWFNNWIQKGKAFNNTFLLRDFKYSGCDGKGNNLFDGYNTAGEEKEMKLTEKFYQTLRHTFVNNPSVKRFFLGSERVSDGIEVTQAEKAWDVAATRNNDGSLYIIEKLSAIAKKMSSNRQRQFDEIIAETVKIVYNTMYQYFESDDMADVLAQNIQKAAKISRMLDPLCSRRPESFGHLLADLQLSEKDSYNFVHGLAEKLGELVNTARSVADNCALILTKCDDFQGCSSDDEKWQRLQNTYHFESRKETADWLETSGIDYKKLFGGEIPAHTNSAVISDEILKYWTERFKKVKFSIDNGNNSAELDFLVKGLVSAAEFVNLYGVINDKMSPIVNGLTVGAFDANEKVQMRVADIIATIINDFVMDFGFSYMSDEQKNSARRINEREHLNCFKCIAQPRDEDYFNNDEKTARLFGDSIEDEGRVPEYFNNLYFSWQEYMYIAFVANINVPDYDRAANEKLKILLDKLR